MNDSRPTTRPTSVAGTPVQQDRGSSVGQAKTNYFAKEPQTMPGSATTPPTRPAPLPKRPKGRLFVGVVVATVLGVACLLVWNSFGRYQAYGSVVGRVVKVASPWSGIIRSMHVREGDEVREGDVIASIESLDLQQRVDRLGDQLKIARANLDAEVARVRTLSTTRDNVQQKAVAEYYELWGQLLQERSRLSDLLARQQRSHFLQHHAAISRKDASSIHFALQGQKAKVAKLEIAVGKLRDRAAVEGNTQSTSHHLLKPKLMEIEILQAQLKRSRKLLQRGVVRAPTSGRVVRARRYTGEHTEADQPLIELLADGSIEAVIYLSQDQGKKMATGKEINVQIPPLPDSIACQVTRIGERLTNPPTSLERYYRKHEPLLPVYLRPIGHATKIKLKLGSEVRVPTELFPT